MYAKFPIGSSCDVSLINRGLKMSGYGYTCMFLCHFYKGEQFL